MAIPTDKNVSGVFYNGVYIPLEPSYDMVINIHTNPNVDLNESASFISEIVSGSVASILSKLEADPNYIPKIFVKWSIYYGTTLTTHNEVVVPWVQYDVNADYLCLSTHWAWLGVHLNASINNTGTATVRMKW
ncbi:MAG: hypothetical protein MJZ20_12435 [Bacteroidaceae bacterium]|nr:hypothetical protein [Bacteroidaceae bacterium]